MGGTTKIQRGEIVKSASGAGLGGLPKAFKQLGGKKSHALGKSGERGEV